MAYPIKPLLLALALGTGFPFTTQGDIITGKVTDLATKASLAGVKVVTTKSQTLSAADGSYTINTDLVTGIPVSHRLPEINWDITSGSFHWDRQHGNVIIEVRDIQGNFQDRFDSRTAPSTNSYALKTWSNGILFVRVSSAIGAYTFRMNRIGNLAVLMKEEMAIGRSEIRALVKVAAVSKVSFTMTGYEAFSQNVEGAKSTLDAALNKTGSLTWKKSRLTWYTSYPDPGSEECIKYSGCDYMGDFAAIGHKDKAWVAAHNLIAVHSKDFNQYKLKTLRLKHADFMIDAQVVDMCADSDCGGCCTQNANTGGGFLIDLESYGVKRFGLDDGTIDWACIDC
jgi:hypothetical protein